MRIQLYTNQPNKENNYALANTEVAMKALSEISDIKKPVKITKESIGPAITVASIAAVCGLIMMSTGFQKNSAKYLKKLKGYLEEKRALSTIHNSKKQTKFYEYAIQETKTFIQKSESINNITSLKDILFMKLMYNSKPTKKIHESISNYFEKISYNTVINSYKNTEKNFEEMNMAFDKLDEFILQDTSGELISHKGKLYTRKELVECAREHRKKANKDVKDFISRESLDKRYKYIKDATSDLYSNFWNLSFKDFWTKNNQFKRKEMWQTFIAAEQIKGDKTELAKEVATVRNSITYTKTDRINGIFAHIKTLYDVIPAYDKTGLEILERIEWLAEHSERFKYNNNGFLNELTNLEKHNIPMKTDASLAKKQEEQKQTYITMIRDLVNYNGRGELQEMMALYYKAAPFELTKSGAALSVKNAVKSFDKSVNLESVEFFDKVRDLRLGSAPTDILTIVLSSLALSFGFGYAKDRDEKISVMFKSGIPVIGGIATAIYTATKLVSGGKSLALGFLSGIVLNRLGIITNNMIKRNKQ